MALPAWASCRILCAFSPSRRGGSDERQSRSPGPRNGGTGAKALAIGPPFGTPDAYSAFAVNRSLDPLSLGHFSPILRHFPPCFRRLRRLAPKIPENGNRDPEKRSGREKVGSKTVSLQTHGNQVSTGQMGAAGELVDALQPLAARLREQGGGTEAEQVRFNSIFNSILVRF